MTSAFYSLTFPFYNKDNTLTTKQKINLINKLFLINFYQEINLRIERFFYLLNIYYIENLFSTIFRIYRNIGLLFDLVLINPLYLLKITLFKNYSLFGLVQFKTIIHTPLYLYCIISPFNHFKQLVLIPEIPQFLNRFGGQNVC